jgi:hypothetical protein
MPSRNAAGLEKLSADRSFDEWRGAFVEKPGKARRYPDASGSPRRGSDSLSRSSFPLPPTLDSLARSLLSMTRRTGHGLRFAVAIIGGGTFRQRKKRAFA